MTFYLLDTDAVIGYFKGFPSTVELIQHLFRQGETLCTCAVEIAGMYSRPLPPERGRG